MKRVIYPLVAVMVVAGLVVGCAAPAPAPAPTPAPAPAPAPAPKPAVEPITWDVVISFPFFPGGPGQTLSELCEAITERTKPELIADFKGGAEVLPAEDQWDGLQTGIIDMAFLFTGYAQSWVPEASAYAVSEVTSAEERELGFYDYMRELHEKYGIYFVSHPVGSGGFLFYSNVYIEEPYSGFRGLRFSLRGPMWYPLAEELGIVPVTLPYREVFTSLMRGIIQGSGAPGIGLEPTRLQEALTYRVDHPFWTSSGGTILANLDSWNSLPKHLQDIVTEEIIKYELRTMPDAKRKYKEERDKLIEQGIEIITFSPEDAEWFVTTADEVQWNAMKESVPESYAFLRKMLRK